MKKIVALLLAALMLLAFASCGKTEKTTETGEGAGEKKVLTMATNAEFPPYEYYDGETVVGIDAEVAKLIADKLGMTLEIADVDFDSIIPGVQSGKYDMGMAGMTVNAERQEKVNFSTSYAKGVQVVIVKEGGSISTLDDLTGKKIGAQQGTTGYLYATASPEDGGYGEENVTGYQNGALAVEALKSGKVDCVIIDNEPAKAYVTANAGLKILDSEFANEDYAICFAKENTDLQKKVNDALESLIADGSLKKVVDKYIKAN